MARNESDVQFSEGLRKLREAHRQKVSTVSGELQSAKQQISTQKQQLLLLEEELANGNRRIVDLERALKEKASENKQLLESRAHLQGEYTALKNQREQLHAFKQAISQLVEPEHPTFGGLGSPTPLYDSPIQQTRPVSRYTDFTASQRSTTNIASLSAMLDDADFEV